MIARKGKPRDAKDKGVILLTTLLIMSVMATVAVSIFDELTFAIRRAANVQSYAQADWYARGAQDYAQLYLSAVTSELSPTDLNRALTEAAPQVFPIEGGVMTLSITDGSQCFALNTLADGSGRQQFRQLLETLGWDRLGAAQLTSQASDWVDSDSSPLPDGAEDGAYLSRTPAHRAGNTAFASVGELRVLPGMNAEKFQRLAPFVCARAGDADGRININTLAPWQAPLLASTLGGRAQSELALRLILDRPAEGYSGLEQFLAAPALDGAETQDADFSLISFLPSHVWIDARIDLLDISREMVMEFDITGDRVQMGFARYGTGYARPIPPEDRI